MEKYERALICVAMVYLLFAIIIGTYFYFKWVDTCSPDGYRLIRGEPQFQNSKPVKCVRLPL